LFGFLHVIGVAAGAGALLWLRARARRRAARSDDRAPVIVWTDEGVRFKCGSCDAWHVGVPNWHFGGPDAVTAMAPAERAQRAAREGDAIVVDEKFCFVLALLELPVQGMPEPYAWGVWVNIRGRDVASFVELYNDEHRPAGATFEGRLGNSIPGYPETRNLPVRLVVRPFPTRPLAEVVDDTHPLAHDQRAGVSQEALRRQITPLFARERPDAGPAAEATV